MTQPDARLELAYDAAKARLGMQDATLGNLRTRANNLLATAALFTSFSAGVGLLNTDPSKGEGILLSPFRGGILLAIIVVLGVCVLGVLLPATNWVFGPSAKQILAKCDSNEDEDSIRRFVTDAMVDGIETNDAKLNWRLWAFRLAAFLLIVEVGLLVSLLTFWKN